MFGDGFLAVVLALYLAELGFDGGQLGLLLSLTLVGDTLISLWLTTSADRLGRRRVLVVGALLMAGAGLVFAFTREPVVLLLAAIFARLSHRVEVVHTSGSAVAGTRFGLGRSRGVVFRLSALFSLD